MLGAWPIATLAGPITAVAIAATAVAASPAVLFALTLRTRTTLHLAFAGKLVELRGLTGRGCRLWLRRLLLWTRLLSLLGRTRPAVRPVGTRSTIGAPIATLTITTLSVALWLAIAAAVAALLEAALLLAIALLIA